MACASSNGLSILKKGGGVLAQRYRFITVGSGSIQIYEMLFGTPAVEYMIQFICE